MINVIGNSCATAHMTKIYFNQGFINPFTYNVIEFNSMKNLIKFWDDINFDNFSLELRPDKAYDLVIDNKVKITYSHYKYDANVDKKILDTDEGRDFISKNIEAFIKEKYIKRLNLMRKYKIDPIFICASRNVENARNNYSVDEIYEILALNTKYKIIICSEFNVDFQNTSTKEFIKIPKDAVSNNGKPLAKFIYENSLLLRK